MHVVAGFQHADAILESAFVMALWRYSPEKGQGIDVSVYSVYSIYGGSRPRGRCGYLTTVYRVRFDAIRENQCRYGCGAQL
jgi:hypothetical protein